MAIVPPITGDCTTVNPFLMGVTGPRWFPIKDNIFITVSKYLAKYSWFFNVTKGQKNANKRELVCQYFMWFL